MRRRRFLKTGGAAGFVGTLALSGCQGNGDGTDDEADDGTTDAGGDGTGDGSGGGTTAPYAKWVYESAYAGAEDPGISAISLRYQTLSQSTDDEGDGGDSETPDDPLLGITASYLIGAALAIGFGVGAAPIGDAAEEGGPTEIATVASGGTILEGAYDPDAIGTAIEEGDGSTVGTDGDYTLYETSGFSAQTLAVSEDAIIGASEGDSVTDSEARVGEIIDTQTGDVTPYVEQDDDFAALASALPERDLTAIQYLPDGNVFEVEDSGEDSEGDSEFAGPSDLGLSGTARGIALSTTIDNEAQSLTTSIAIKYASADEADDRATVESAIGTAATDQSITVDGDTVIVEGTYDESVSQS